MGREEEKKRGREEEGKRKERNRGSNEQRSACVHSEEGGNKRS